MSKVLEPGGNSIGEIETFVGFWKTKGLEGGIRGGGLEMV